MSKSQLLPNTDPQADWPSLNSQPKYYFGYGVGPHNQPSLEAVKTWMHGDEQRFDTFTIAEYGMWEEALTDERELEDTLKTQGLEATIKQAERMAVEGGYLDSNRADGRVFFQDNAPHDPFTTEREQIMEREMQHSDGQQNPEYSIDAITANGEARLDVLKTWGDDQQEYERLLIPQPDWETAQGNAETAHGLLEKGDLQSAMTLVELTAIEAGVIDPQRDDPRLFTEGPPDHFSTIRERELTPVVNITEMDTEPLVPIVLGSEAENYQMFYQDVAAEATHNREANAGVEGAAWFEVTFEKSPIELLQPVNDTVNYAVVVQEADPWTLELAVEKYWKEPGGYLGMQSLTLDTWDSEDDQARETAEQERDALMEVHDQRGLEAMMHQAELTVVQNEWLDAGRADPRLFTQGPTDRFETLAQQLEGEINPYWNTRGEKVEDEPERPEVEIPYWRLDTLPVNDPEGQPLGHALYMVVYPDLEHNPNMVDAPIIGEDEPFKMMEMAYFETTAAADKFSKEFIGYLIPGVLDGPDLAVEVARLENLPTEWKTLEGGELKAYQNAELTLTCDASNWHPYNPNAEHDARIATEGLYSDPIQGTQHDEPETTPNTQELDF